MENPDPSRLQGFSETTYAQRKGGSCHVLRVLGFEKPPFDNVPDPSMYVDCHRSMENALQKPAMPLRREMNASPS